MAVSTIDADRRQDGFEGETLGSVENYATGVVVSRQDVEEMVVAECRRSLPSFAAPQLVVVTRAIPTLPGSGKVDHRKARQMIIDNFYDIRNSGNTTSLADDTATCTLASPRQGEASVEKDNVDEIVNLIMAAIESTFKSQGDKEGETRGGAPNRLTEDTIFFAEVGLSSVQAGLATAMETVSVSPMQSALLPGSLWIDGFHVLVIGLSQFRNRAE